MILSADNCIDQLLVATATVYGYDYSRKNKVKTFTSGATVGTIFSWVNDESNQIWWMFMLDDNTTYYVLHDPSKMKLPGIDDANANGVVINPLSSLSVDQQVANYKANQETHWYDSILKGLKDVGTVAMYAAIIFIVVFTLIEINKRYPLKNLIKK
jgi:hypothetical protein